MKETNLFHYGEKINKKGKEKRKGREGNAPFYQKEDQNIMQSFVSELSFPGFHFLTTIKHTADLTTSF